MICERFSASSPVSRMAIRLTPEAAVARNLCGREIRGAINLVAEAEEEATDADVRVAACSMVDRSSRKGEQRRRWQNDGPKTVCGYESGRRSSRKD